MHLWVFMVLAACLHVCMFYLRSASIWRSGSDSGDEKATATGKRTVGRPNEDIVEKVRAAIRTYQENISLDVASPQYRQWLGDKSKEKLRYNKSLMGMYTDHIQAIQDQKWR